MSNESPTRNTDEIACEILTYLADHPSAHDTLEGIVKWWLLERKIRYQADQVKYVLDTLVLKDLIVEQKTIGQPSTYRTNKEKNDVIRTMTSRTEWCKQQF